MAQSIVEYYLILFQVNNENNKFIINFDKFLKKLFENKEKLQKKLANFLLQKLVKCYAKTIIKYFL